MRALVAVFFLIFATVPSGACCASRPAEAAVVDHFPHHGAPDNRAPADHPAPAFVCVAFCAATPVAATVTAPRVGPAIEAEPPTGPEPDGFEGQPAPPPPRLV